MSFQDAVVKLKAASTDSFTRTAGIISVIGIIVGVGGPLALWVFGGREAINLPWYIWTIMLLLLLLAITRGLYLFKTHDADDNSINPNRR